jgi:hypothetical protein
VRTIPTKKELERIAKEQGIPEPEGEPDIPKKPPKIEDLDSETQWYISDLKKQLKSERSRANAHERYRKAEDAEHMVALEELNQAQKDRDDAKDRVKELEKPSSKNHTINIGAQTHYRKDRKDAVAHAKELLDADVWWITLGREE